jgi:hypothetical protein
MSWRDDFERSDRYIPAIKRIISPRVGSSAVDVASFDIDSKEVTDLIVRDTGLRIALRVRNKDKYFRSFRYEFTIRSGRPRGTKTELAKILEGYGDWLFYGWGESDYSVSDWCLVDLHVFRSVFRCEETREALNRAGGYGAGFNPSDKTRFGWFKLPLFPKEPSIVIACSPGCDWRVPG